MTTQRTRSAKQQPAKESEQPSGLPALEERLGYTFTKPELLQLALTHRSFTYEAKHGPDQDPYGGGRNVPGEDNEQLEFVGDAVLELVVTEAMFREFPDRTEGELTRLRAALVSRECMSRMGKALGLGELILLGRSAESLGARSKPALLANAAEAVLAALYLDAKERGLDIVRGVVHRFLIDPELPNLRSALAHDEGRGALRDSKTLLQERVQANGSGRLLYVDTAQSGPAHQRRFAVEARLESESGSVVLASAEGNSKKEAQQRAAAEALENWDKATAGSAQERGASMKGSVWTAPYQNAGIKPKRVRGRHAGGGVSGLVKALAEVVVLALFVVMFIVQPYSIPTGSMEPTLMVGDFLLVDKQAYGPNGVLDKVLPPEEVNRDDIVVFHFPSDPNRTLVKRVIGVPGDRLHLHDGVVYLNGAPLQEPFAVHSRAVHDIFRDEFPSLRTADPNADPRWWVELRSIIGHGEITVPKDRYFVLGDNRDNSEDSRYWGFVSRDEIVGQPLFVYFTTNVSADPYPSSASARLRDIASQVRVVR